ncbi:hypothetical protein OROGR_010355 [Orobanche gracilis]
MYFQARTCVRTLVGDTQFFTVEIGLHQGSAFSPLLLALIMDVISWGIQGGVPWCVLFADDIVLVVETRREVNEKLELLMYKLESLGLRVSRSKTEYLWCNLSVENNEKTVEVRIADQIVPRTDKFKYLSSIIHKEGEVEDDVTHRIKAGWLKWRAATRVLCDKKVPIKLKGKFYKAAIRPAMLYGSECWAGKKSLESKLEAAEMRMLRWSCGRTMMDRIPNRVFRNVLEVAPISAKIREGRLRWDTGKLQQTVANCIERTGQGLHSGNVFTVKILPSSALYGRCFIFRSTVIRASIDNVVKETPLCTTISQNGYKISTVEHLLSALEATGVDNCRLEIEGSGDCDRSAEVPIFDGSAREWVEAINQAGLKVAVDSGGGSCEKLAPYLSEPVHVMKNDSFISAFPCPEVSITYGIDYPQHYSCSGALGDQIQFGKAPTIGRQWFSSTLSDENFYSKAIASARTFCLYEEVEHMRNLGLIKGGSAETAIICSMSKGWLNPPLSSDASLAIRIRGREYHLINGLQGVDIRCTRRFVRCLLGIS